MLKKIALLPIIVIAALGCTGTAYGQDRVHTYLNDMAVKVKSTDNPDQKREILSEGLSGMADVLVSARNSSLTSDEDDLVLDRTLTTINDKRDELAGVNGFERVPDDRLDAFSTYIVQDIEQADQTLHISLVAALLIVIIIILIA